MVTRHSMYRGIICKYTNQRKHKKVYKGILWTSIVRKRFSPAQCKEIVYPWSMETMPIRQMMLDTYKIYQEKHRRHFLKKYSNITHTEFGFLQCVDHVEEVCKCMTDEQWSALGVQIHEDTTIRAIKFIHTGANTFVMFVILSNESTFVVKICSTKSGEIQNLLHVINHQLCVSRIPRTIMHHFMSYLNTPMTILFQEYAPSLSNIESGATLFRKILSDKELFHHWVDELMEMIRYMRNKELICGDFKLENIGVRLSQSILPSDSTGKKPPFQLVFIDLGFLHAFHQTKELKQTTAESQWLPYLSINPFIKDCTGLFSICYSMARLLVFIKRGYDVNNYEMYHYIHQYVSNRTPHLSALRLLFMFFAKLRKCSTYCPTDEHGKGWQMISGIYEKRQMTNAMYYSYANTYLTTRIGFAFDIPLALYDILLEVYPDLKTCSEKERNIFFYHVMHTRSMAEKAKGFTEFQFEEDKHIFRIDHNLLNYLQQEQVWTPEQEAKHIDFMIRIMSHWQKVGDISGQERFLQGMKEWMTFLYDSIGM
jgi:hypothetical protein